MSSTHTDKNNPFCQCTNKHSQFTSNRAPIDFSRIALPTIVLPEDDNPDFGQEERLNLPHCTMIEAICVVVHRTFSSHQCGVKLMETFTCEAYDVYTAQVKKRTTHLDIPGKFLSPLLACADDMPIVQVNEAET